MHEVRSFPHVFERMVEPRSITKSAQCGFHQRDTLLSLIACCETFGLVGYGSSNC